MNRILKNTSSLFSAHLIGRLGSLVITLWLMPRYFTESELGGYFVAIALTNLIAILTELGIQNPLIREMTLHIEQTRHYLGNALIVRCILSIIAYGIMIVSGMFLYTPTNRRDDRFLRIGRDCQFHRTIVSVRFSRIRGDEI